MFVQTIIKTLKYFLKSGVPSHILYFGDSLGDNLLITTIARELNNRGYKNIWVKCNRPLMFENNKDIKLVIPLNTLLSSLLLKTFSVKVCQLKYTEYIEAEDRDLIPNKHIILKFMECLGLQGNIQNKPMLNLYNKEKQFGKFSKNQITICTSSNATIIPMKNKEWYTARYQQIVNTLKTKYQFIQIGVADDEPLENVIDMRGKTTIRETASILFQSKLLVSHVGFLMHLARAVDCGSVIIYGGREHPNQSGYSCNSNIYQKEDCSPCWQHNRCDFDKMCMDKISVEAVIKAIQFQIVNSEQELEIDILIND